MAFEFGLSLHTVTTDLTSRGLRIFESSLVKAFELKQALFDGPESSVRKETLRQFMANNGIRAATIHASFGDPFDLSSANAEVRDRGMQAVRDAIGLATFFGAPIIVVHASAEPISESERGVRLAIAQQSLQLIEPDARAAGKKLAVEILPRTCLGRTVAEVLQIIGPLDPQVVGACLDTNHFMEDFASVPEAVGGFESRLMALHLSDYDGIDEQHWLPGRGVVQWPAFFDALRAVKYGGPFIYECSFRPRERLAMLCENYFWLSQR